MPAPVLTNTNIRLLPFGDTLDSREPQGGFPTDPSTGPFFAFGDVPDQTFIEGKADSQQLGIWHLDPSNPVQPGDTYWKTPGATLQRHYAIGGGPWAPAPNRRATLEVRIGETLPAGLVYSPTTGLLTYDATLLGDNERHRTVTVRLRYEGTVSNWFAIRILRPAVVFGYGVGLMSFPSTWSSEYTTKYEASVTRFADAVSSVAGTWDAPFVFYLLNGEYRMDAEMQKELRWLLAGNGTSTQRARCIRVASIYPNGGTGVCTVETAGPHNLTNTDTDQLGASYGRQCLFTGLTGAYEFLNGLRPLVRVLDATRLELYWGANVIRNGALTAAEVPVDATGLGTLVPADAWLNSFISAGAGIGTPEQPVKYLLGETAMLAKLDSSRTSGAVNAEGDIVPKPDYGRFTFNGPGKTFSPLVYNQMRRISIIGATTIEGVMVSALDSDLEDWEGKLPVTTNFNSQCYFTIPPGLPNVAQDGFGSDSIEGSTLNAGPLDGLAPNSGGPEPRVGVPTANSDWWSDFTQNEFEGWIGGGGTKHNIYLHGRPAGKFTSNSNFQHGSGAGIAMKTTRYYVRHRNNLYWSFRNPYPGAAQDKRGGAFTKFIDFPSRSDGACYNCEMVALNDGDRTITEMVMITPRQTLWGGNDRPPYPDIMFQREDDDTPCWFKFGESGVSDFPQFGQAVMQLQAQGSSTWVNALTPIASRGGNNWAVALRPSELASGVYRLRIKGFDKSGNADVSSPPPDRNIAWIQVWKNGTHCMVTGVRPDVDETREWFKDGPRAWGLDGEFFALAGAGPNGESTAELRDPANPYTSKHYFALCRFITLPESVFRRRPLRDEGCNPRSAAGTGSSYLTWGSLSPRFNSLSVNYLVNCEFIGWTPDDMTREDPEEPGRFLAWIRMDSAAYNPDKLDNDGQPLHTPYGPTLPPTSVPDADIVFVGGNRTPDKPREDFIELPSWFKA